MTEETYCLPGYRDSKHIVWMKTQLGHEPSRNSQIHLMNTETGESRRLFTDPEQLKFSNSMPVVSPKGDRIAFVSNRSGVMRIWVSNLDGSNARQISKPEMDYHQAIKASYRTKSSSVVTGQQMDCSLGRCRDDPPQQVHRCQRSRARPDDLSDLSCLGGW